MVIPGIDEELDLTEIASHDVIEQIYWSLNFTKITGLNGDVDASSHKAAIDSGTSLIMGPKTILKLLLEGITVEQDCSNLDSLPPCKCYFSSLISTLISQVYSLLLIIKHPLAIKA